MKKNDDTLTYFTKKEMSGLIQNSKVNVLMDMSALMYRMIYGFANEFKANGFSDIGIFKYYVMNTFINAANLFPDTELVILLDKKDKHNHYWRHSILENYKSNRKNMPSILPKDFIYKTFTEMTEDIKNYVPYKIVEIEGTEADDIMSVLVQEKAMEFNIMFSSDKDFRQLHTFEKTYQYDPMKKTFYKDRNPDKYKFYHILQGDSGDGIPNFLSKEDVFVPEEGKIKRQKMLTKKKIGLLYEQYKQFGSFGIKSDIDDFEYNRYLDNKKCIDLFDIPKDISLLILNEFYQYKPKGTIKSFWKYCVDNNFDIADKLL